MFDTHIQGGNERWRNIKLNHNDYTYQQVPDSAKESNTQLTDWIRLNKEQNSHLVHMRTYCKEVCGEESQFLVNYNFTTKRINVHCKSSGHIHVLVTFEDKYGPVR